MLSLIQKMIAGIALSVIAFHSFAQDNALTEQEIKAGWTLLFDGKTTTGWKAVYGDAFPKNGWKIEDGVLSVLPSKVGDAHKGGDIVTLQSFDHFELTLDFKLSEGANSGVKYFVDPEQAVTDNPMSGRGLEYQLLDDDRHKDANLGKNGNRKTASLYDIIPAAADKPIKPVGQWNSLRIVANNNHIEHWLNGVKVLEFERGSQDFQTMIAGSKFKAISGFGMAPRGRILLQDHSDLVGFKNIKIRSISGTSSAAPGIMREM
jgi:Domain of Unknown Function (DUF1080)